MARVHMTLRIACFGLLALMPATAPAQSYLQAPAGASYNATSSGFTVECWARVRSEPGFDPRIIRCVGPTEGPCGNSSVEVWELYICKSSCASGTVHFGMQHAGVCYDVPGNTAVNDGSYHHLAATYDGAVASLYVDGALDGSVPIAGLNVLVSGGKVVVGNSTAYNNAFDGQVDEVRIWSVARSQSQIASAAATEISPQPGLEGYWRLNGDGTDLVGGNTLVANGAVTFVAGKLNQAADIAISGGSPPPVVAQLFTTPYFQYSLGAPMPSSVASGDLNGDGRPDLAVAHGAQNVPGNNTVSVMLGNGNATFGSHVEYDAGARAWSVAIGDLNGDGKRDLVVATDSSRVAVLLGNGDGSFGPRSYYATGPRSQYVALADLNADGKLDLVETIVNGVAVLLGNGDGTFASATDYASGSVANTVAIDDLNGDGKLDLVIANANGNLSVLLGNGDGTFGPRSDYPVAVNCNFVAIADLNADGRPDLVATDSQNAGAIVVLGNGDGTFGDGTVYTGGECSFGYPERSVAIGDLNGDGHPDVLLGNANNTMSVLLGNGDGTFGDPVDYGFTDYSPVVIGDLNGDGRLDVVAAGAQVGVGYLVSVLPGNGDGTFGPKTAIAGNGPTCVAIGDFNGDGKPDLGVANVHSGTVSVLLGNGDGSFKPKTDYGTGSVDPHFVAIGDLNRDGKLDLVTGDGSAGTLSVLLNNGGGSFGARTTYAAGAQPQSVAIADFNGDGKPDVVSANLASNTVSVLLGNGDGTLGAKTDFPTGTNPQSVAIGDLNRDGTPDLVVVNSGSKSVSVLLGIGNGTFGPKTDILLTNVGDLPNFVAIGDLNGDQKPDLAVANNNSVSVFLGNGDGTFGPRADFSLGPYQAWSVAIGDLDGDGKPDLAVANFFVSGVAVLLGNGNGTFGPATYYGTGTGPQFVAIGDLNGDGRPDLVTANECSNGVSVLFNTGGLPFLRVPPGPLVPSTILSMRIWPTPSPGTVAIQFHLPQAGAVDLRVHDLAGRLVRILSRSTLPAGEHMVRWDRRTLNGVLTQPGIYFISLRAGGEHVTNRLALVH